MLVALLLLFAPGCGPENALSDGKDAGAPFDDGTDPTVPDDTDADTATVEECNGLDDDGDGEVDEGFDDADGDGRADCVDRECPNPDLRTRLPHGWQ